MPSGRPSDHVLEHSPSHMLRAGMIEPALNGLPQSMDTLLADFGKLRSPRHQGLHLGMGSGKPGLVFACGHAAGRRATGGNSALGTVLVSSE
jgi:hypothetical protein